VLRRRGKQLIRRLRIASNRGRIPPEIIDDAFYDAIAAIAADPRVRTILEIGASSGEGSTTALIEGARRNPSRPTIHAIEALPRRYRALIERHGAVEFLKAYNVSSISAERFPSEERIRSFYQRGESRLGADPLSVVLSWRRSDLKTIATHHLTGDGIRMIKAREGIDLFDMVLIDGSEFTGAAELEDVYGAKFLLLDDIRTFKNFDNHQRLIADENYRLVEMSEELRNGYSIFERRGASD